MQKPKHNPPTKVEFTNPGLRLLLVNLELPADAPTQSAPPSTAPEPPAKK